MSSFLQAFWALFFIIDPFGNLGVFDALFQQCTDDRDAVMKRAGWLAPTVAGVLLLLTVFFGNKLFDFFDISLDILYAAAGILLLFPAVRLVEYGEPVSPNALKAYTEKPDWTGLAYVPLAIPLLAGPGAIAATMLYARELGWQQTIALVVVILLVVFLCFRYVSPVMHRGRLRKVMKVLGKITGIVLTALAINFIFRGFFGYAANWWVEKGTGLTVSP
jgi:multiple antibiotic resistance protein